MSHGDRGNFRCLHKPRTMPRSPPLPAQTRHTTKITIYGCSTSRSAARRSQPRTVAAGTPISAPMRRCPHPSPRARNAAQIQSAAYALRDNTVTGNNTCVTAHARQRARRGRTGSTSPAILRARPYPHPPSTPPQHGHPNLPGSQPGLDADRLLYTRTCWRRRTPRSSP